MKTIYITLAFCVIALVVVVSNELLGTAMDTSEPYARTSMYCAAWQPNKVGVQCMVYANRTQTVVDTKVKGLFFDATSYRVVE